MLIGEAMNSVTFEKFYRDATLRGKIRRLSSRYHRSYCDLLAFGGYYDSEEIESELWARMAESESEPCSSALFFSEVMNDMHNIVRDAKGDQGWRDPMVHAMHDEDGNEEGQEETIDRMYYGAS